MSIWGLDRTGLDWAWKDCTYSFSFYHGWRFKFPSDFWERRGGCVHRRKGLLESEERAGEKMVPISKIKIKVMFSHLSHSSGYYCFVSRVVHGNTKYERRGE